MPWEFPDYPDNWDELRRDVLIRDDFKCQECDRSDITLHVHHVLSLSNGGSNNLSNLKTLCVNCHTRKHSHMKHKINKPRVSPKPYIMKYPPIPYPKEYPPLPPNKKSPPIPYLITISIAISLGIVILILFILNQYIIIFIVTLSCLSLIFISKKEKKYYELKKDDWKNEIKKNENNYKHQYKEWERIETIKVQMYENELKEYQIEQEKKAKERKKVLGSPFCPKCKSLMFPFKDNYLYYGDKIFVCGNTKCQYQIEISQ